jgi:hypothetical protein
LTGAITTIVFQGLPSTSVALLWTNMKPIVAKSTATVNITTDVHNLVYHFAILSRIYSAAITKIQAISTITKDNIMIILSSPTTL